MRHGEPGLTPRTTLRLTAPLAPTPVTGITPMPPLNLTRLSAVASVCADAIPVTMNAMSVSTRARAMLPIVKILFIKSFLLAYAFLFFIQMNHCLQYVQVPFPSLAGALDSIFSRRCGNSSRDWNVALRPDD